MLEVEVLINFYNRLGDKLRGAGDVAQGIGLSQTEADIVRVLGRANLLSNREIAEQLRLDAGYLSRLLKGLEARDLLHKRASVSDKRSNDLVLTTKGRKLFDLMLRLEAEATEKMLAAVSGHKRSQMRRAVKLIEQAFEAPNAMAGVTLRAPQVGDISWVVHRQAVLYRHEYGWDERFEALLHHIADTFISQFKPDRERAWIAEYGGEIVGSMFLIEQEAEVAQLRMLYVEPHVRGLGIGKRLLEKSVQFAREKGYRAVRLWTNNVLHTARGMYERADFRLIEEKPHAEFGEKLVAQVWEKLL